MSGPGGFTLQDDCSILDHESVRRRESPTNAYLGSAGGNAVPAMPGTNMDTASPWSSVVVIDGRFGLAGVYAPDGSKRSGGTLSVLPQTREIILTVPRSSTTSPTGRTRARTCGGSPSTASAAARW
jgi:hypothetical protein